MQAHHIDPIPALIIFSIVAVFMIWAIWSGRRNGRRFEADRIWSIQHRQSELAALVRQNEILERIAISLEKV